MEMLCSRAERHHLCLHGKGARLELGRVYAPKDLDKKFGCVPTTWVKKPSVLCIGRVCFPDLGVYVYEFAGIDTGEEK